MSHRLGGLIKGFRAFTDDWTNMRSSSSFASAPTSATDFHYNNAKGIWNTRSTTNFYKEQTGLSVSVVGQTSYPSVSNQTSGTVTTPAGSASGDMLVSVVQSGTVAPNTPSGWTLSYSSDGASQKIYIFTLNLTAAPASSYAFTFASTTSFNISLFTLRKAAGTIVFGSATSAVDTSLTSVVFPTLTTTDSATLIAVSAVRSTNTTAVTVPVLGSGYTVISNISNATSTVAARMLMTEYIAVGAGSNNPATKTLPTTVSGVTATLFSVS